MLKILGERSSEKLAKIQHAVFELSDEEFERAMNMVPPHKRGFFRVPRRILKEVLEGQDPKLIGLGTECAVFSSPNDMVTKVFFGLNGKRKYRELSEDYEIIKTFGGDAVIDTETRQHPIRLCGFGRLVVPVQKQKLVNHGKLPSDSSSAEPQVVQDLSILLEASETMSSQHGRWMDLGEHNFAANNRLILFDVSAFDPSKRGPVDTASSLAIHQCLSEYVAAAKIYS